MLKRLDTDTVCVLTSGGDTGKYLTDLLIKEAILNLACKGEVALTEELANTLDADAFIELKQMEGNQ